MSGKLLGSEVPRIWTKPLRELTPDTSLGFEVIEFSESVVGLQLLPWQKWLLIHALELLEDGSLRFRNVVVLVARQNGKSTVSKILALWWLYVCGVRTVLGTAQDLDTAEDVWEGVVELIDDTPQLAEMADKPIRVNGKKAIRLLTGERYRVKAANRRAGRGLTGERVLLDELREHQSWDAWGAITKTTRAKAGAQIWSLSNAGDQTSVVLRHLRKLGHEALGDPDGIVAADRANLLPDEDTVAEINVGIADEDGVDLEPADFETSPDDLAMFEWSAPPGCDIWDRNGWGWSNPSLGYLISEKTIASEARTDTEWTFRTEVLCQWPEGALVGSFPTGSWDMCGVQPRPDGLLAPYDRINPRRRVVWGLQLSWDRRRAYVAVAGTRNGDDLPQVEIAAKRAGSDWVVDWFCDPSKPERKTRPIAIQPGSPAWSLAAALVEAGCEVVEWKGAELTAGCGQFFDAVQAAVIPAEDGTVKGPQVRHHNDPSLNLAAQTAEVKPLGAGSWVWDQKASPQDAAPLIAANSAYWLLRKPLIEKQEDLPPPVPRTVPAVDRSRRPDIARMGF